VFFNGFDFPAGNYPQGDVFTPQGLDDFWKGNTYEKK